MLSLGDCPWHCSRCISERVPERCTYSGNVPIVAIVLVCNAIKVAVMLFVALRLQDHPLITVGDAVESFLNDNDKTTEGLCLFSRKDVVRAARRKRHDERDALGAVGIFRVSGQRQCDQ